MDLKSSPIGELEIKLCELAARYHHTQQEQVEKEELLKQYIEILDELLVRSNWNRNIDPECRLTEVLNLDKYKGIFRKLPDWRTVFLWKI